jgi:hypothetical protein
MSTESEPVPFSYPEVPHRRRHNPSGYTDYRTFKPWLRDEFEFRCVFCRRREMWLDGQNSFSVEHLKPYKLAPHLDCVYTNLLYSCLRCNSFKQTQWPVLDPCNNSYATHFRVHEDGTIEGLTRDGKRVIRFLRLDHPDMNEARRRKIFEIRALWTRRHEADLAAVLRDELKYPSELPDLSRLEPEKNTKEDGIYHSHFERRKRGELPETY